MSPSLISQQSNHSDFELLFLPINSSLRTSTLISRHSLYQPYPTINMQFAIFASFAALALAAPWKPETSTCSTSTVAATTTSAAAVTATTAASAPGVTPISGTGSSGSGSGSSGSGSSGSGSSGSGSGSEADLCPALYTPQCCQADVLGLVGLTCNSRE